MAWIALGSSAAGQATFVPPAGTQPGAVIQPPAVFPQAPPVYAPGPATLDGAIQPLDPSWDPYADPIEQPVQPVYPEEGYFYTRPDGTIGQRERLVQQVRLEYTHLFGDDPDDLEIDDIETSATFAVPFAYGVAPLLITPGFGLHFWDGPDSSAYPGSPDLPPQVYDAWLDVGWRPQLTPRLSLDLGVRPGIYSDFEFVNSESFRIKGRALGIFTASPQLQWVAGVLYLDRKDVKILPAGGAIWTPDECTRWEILFPRPKFAHRFTMVGNTEWWWYVAGEYGGDTWTIERADGTRDVVDYSDLRLTLGLEWISFSGLRGHFEAGYVFDREVDYKRTGPDFEPDETFLLRAGVAY